MRSVHVSELKPGDVIYFSYPGWNPRRRVVSNLESSDRKIDLHFQDAGVAFIAVDAKTQLFEVVEILRCSTCDRDTEHSLGICNECTSEYSEKVQSKSAPIPTSSVLPNLPPPPTVERRSPTYDFQPVRRQVGGGDLVSLFVTATGVLTTLGGLAQIALAFWLYHLTDTGRVEGLDSTIRAIETEAGIQTQNEFHVIAFGIGASGILFALIGITLLTVFWFTDRAN